MPKHRRFEFKDGTSNKFWDIELQGKSLTVRWGRIGSEGQNQAKVFASADAAHRACEQLVAEKLAKGYTETSVTGTTAPSPAQPAAAGQVVPTTPEEFEAGLLALFQDVQMAAKDARRIVRELCDILTMNVTGNKHFWHGIDRVPENYDRTVKEKAEYFIVRYSDRLEFHAGRCDDDRLYQFCRRLNTTVSSVFRKIRSQQWIGWVPWHLTAPRPALVEWYGKDLEAGEVWDEEPEDEQPKREEKPQKIAVIWRRLEKWTKKNAPKVWKSLRKGATAAQIRRAEKTLGLSLPEDYKESCRIHDGQSNYLGFIAGWPLLSLEEVVYQWQAWKELADKKRLPKLQPKPDAALRKAWWSARWVPVTYSGAGDHHCIDLDPSPRGTAGQIIQMSHDDPDRSLQASSFRAWLQEFAADLEDGNYEVDEDGGLEY